jgi:hypothetical protein
MDAEVATFGEGLATVGVRTHVRSLASVLPPMDLQRARTPEGASTLRTAEWPDNISEGDVPLIGVSTPVVLEVATCDEAAGAAGKGALVWSLAGVGPHVGLEVALLAEGLVASRLETSERSFPRLRSRKEPYMGTRVDLKARLSPEPLVAVRTGVGLGTGCRPRLGSLMRFLCDIVLLLPCHALYVRAVVRASY